MSDKQIFRQCELRLIAEDRIYKDVCWIPAKFAQAGKILSLKNPDGTWITGWTVVEVYDAKDFSELQIQRWAQKRWEDVLEPVTKR